jgi:GxxExxY protein
MGTTEHTENTEKETDLLYKEETYAIRGAIFEVYREVGSGFLEAVYQECLERELEARSIPFVPQVELQMTYKGAALQQTYKPDLVCYGKIIVELKAMKELDNVHRAQVYNYLRLTGLRLGLLVNFGHFPMVTVERIVV